MDSAGALEAPSTTSAVCSRMRAARALSSVPPCPCLRACSVPGVHMAVAQVDCFCSCGPITDAVNLPPTPCVSSRTRSGAKGKGAKAPPAPVPARERRRLVSVDLTECAEIGQGVKILPPVSASSQCSNVSRSSTPQNQIRFDVRISMTKGTGASTLIGFRFLCHEFNMQIKR